MQSQPPGLGRGRQDSGKGWVDEPSVLSGELTTKEAAKVRQHDALRGLLHVCPSRASVVDAKAECLDQNERIWQVALFAVY